MKILADESTEGPFVAWLRGQGHDVTWIADIRPGTDDEWIIAAANAQERILVTCDRDFGELVFRMGKRVPGVVYLRLPGATLISRLAAFAQAWPYVESVVTGHYVVLAHGRIRVRPLP